ncbi:hypothetical protein EDB92DRAFT_1000653 [Lactarius akahatsu]|uniref:Uncharacterized protein n=1 Tax=Lactarius akahatsu TaxID=416441 RepID=A0AAD4QC39_9AGAM|nr:hypothetical protein EDB92DRAFT_1000653 [Lactarius akahatsu]
MTGDDCSDCGLPHHVHFREDGLYGCPVDTPMPYPNDGARQEPTRTPSGSNCATVTCPNVYDTSTERVRSESPDPLLLAPDKQLPQRYSTTQRRSIHSVDVPMPLRRSFRVENRRRVREGAEPYTQSQMRRSSLRDAFRRSHPRRASLQDNRRSSHRSSENEGVSLEQNRPPERFRRASPQQHVLERMVPVEDMEMIEGFQPFTELEPGQQAEPVTVREPMTDPPRGPFQYVWNPSVTFPEVGGMRVRVGQFERTEHRVDDATPLAWSDGNESSSSGSSSEGYFTAQDWTPSVDLPPSQPPPDFIQGSSKSVLPPQTWVGGDTYPPSIVANEDAEFPQLEALAQHFTAVHEKSVFATPPAPASCPPVDPKHFEGLTMPPPHPDITAPQDTSSAPPNQLSRATTARHTSRPIMPGTLPGTRITDYRPSDSVSGLAERAMTEAAVDEREDWATREPWEYVHRVLTSSTRPLVMFLKTPTADIPAAALGVLSADLRLQKMLVDNEHWLLVGPRGVDLHEFGVRFQTRARTPDKFVFRFGTLNWGADVNQIEDEVCKAMVESSMRGRGRPAMLPAQFMAGAVGGLVVWYALSLM